MLFIFLTFFNFLTSLKPAHLGTISHMGLSVAKFENVQCSCDFPKASQKVLSCFVYLNLAVLRRYNVVWLQAVSKKGQKMANI